MVVYCQFYGYPWIGHAPYVHTCTTRAHEHTERTYLFFIAQNYITAYFDGPKLQMIKLCLSLWSVSFPSKMSLYIYVCDVMTRPSVFLCLQVATLPPPLVSSVLSSLWWPVPQCSSLCLQVATLPPPYPLSSLLSVMTRPSVFLSLSSGGYPPSSSGILCPLSVMTRPSVFLSVFRWLPSLLRYPLSSPLCDDPSLSVPLCPQVATLPPPVSSVLSPLSDDPSLSVPLCLQVSSVLSSLWWPVPQCSSLCLQVATLPPPLVSSVLSPPCDDPSLSVPLCLQVATLPPPVSSVLSPLCDDPSLSVPLSVFRWLPFLQYPLSSPLCDDPSLSVPLSVFRWLPSLLVLCPLLSLMTRPSVFLSLSSGGYPPSSSGILCPLSSLWWPVPQCSSLSSGGYPPSSSGILCPLLSVMTRPSVFLSLSSGGYPPSSGILCPLSSLMTRPSVFLSLSSGGYPPSSSGIRCPLLSVMTGPSVFLSLSSGIRCPLSSLWWPVPQCSSLSSGGYPPSSSGILGISPAPAPVCLSPAAVDGQTELDAILNELLGEASSPVGKSTSLARTGLGGASPTSGSITTNSGNSRTIMSWQTSDAGPSRTGTVTRETTRPDGTLRSTLTRSSRSDGIPPAGSMGRAARNAYSYSVQSSSEQVEEKTETETVAVSAAPPARALPRPTPPDSDQQSMEWLQAQMDKLQALQGGAGGGVGGGVVGEKPRRQSEQEQRLVSELKSAQTSLARRRTESESDAAPGSLSPEGQRSEHSYYVCGVERPPFTTHQTQYTFSVSQARGRGDNEGNRSLSPLPPPSRTASSHDAVTRSRSGNRTATTTVTASASKAIAVTAAAVNATAAAVTATAAALARPIAEEVVVEEKAVEEKSGGPAAGRVCAACVRVCVLTRMLPLCDPTLPPSVLTRPADTNILPSYHTLFARKFTSIYGINSN